MNLFSYVLKYDSGFAPNPFYGYCTLATCKPKIRERATMGDWVVSSGSVDKRFGQGGHLVYAMRVDEILPFDKYYLDTRFKVKRPNLRGSRKQARGDNIYHRINEEWQQSDSYHTHKVGSPNSDHIKRDTSIDRVLISQCYVYYGGSGPRLPNLASNGKLLCHSGRAHKIFKSSISSDKRMIDEFVSWFESLKEHGYISPPFDWRDTQ